MSNMNCNDSPIPSTNECANLSKSGVKKQYFTPCRQVGLRRRSGSAKMDETSGSKTERVASAVIDTPKGPMRFQSRKRILSPSGSSPVQTKLEKLENETIPEISVSVSKDAIPSELNDKQIEVRNEGKKVLSASFVDPELLKDKTKAVAILDEIKKRVDAKEKLKNSLQLRLYKLKKGNAHVTRLEALRSNWKEACQEALKDLLIKSNMQGHSLTMKLLMKKLGISHELLPYNSDEEEFEDSDL